MKIKVTSLHDSMHWRDWATHIISLVGPELIDSYFKPHTPIGKNHFIRFFHDISNDEPGLVKPTIQDVLDILNFSKKFDENTNLLVHCHAGISRSTAAAIGIMVQHGKSPEEAVQAIAEDRPEMWPNSLLIHYFDECLVQVGTLREAVKLYKANGRRISYISPDTRPQYVSDMEILLAALAAANPPEKV